MTTNVLRTVVKETRCITSNFRVINECTWCSEGGDPVVTWGKSGHFLVGIWGKNKTFVIILFVPIGVQTVHLLNRSHKFCQLNKVSCGWTKEFWFHSAGC
jgi:hypothetical protein